MEFDASSCFSRVLKLGDGKLRPRVTDASLIWPHLPSLEVPDWVGLAGMACVGDAADVLDEAERIHCWECGEADVGNDDSGNGSGSSEVGEIHTLHAYLGLNHYSALRSFHEVGC